MKHDAVNIDKNATNDLMMKLVHDLGCDIESIYAVIERLPDDAGRQEHAILTLVAMNVETVLRRLNQFSTSL